MHMPCLHRCGVSLAAVKQLGWGLVTLLSKIGANIFCLHEVVGFTVNLSRHQEQGGTCITHLHLCGPLQASLRRQGAQRLPAPV